MEDAVYEFTRDRVRRLAVKFGESLKLNEELYDFIRREKSGEPFDFEPSIDEAETLTTPEEMFFYMHWLKTRGRPAQLVPPNLGFKKRQAYPAAMATARDRRSDFASTCITRCGRNSCRAWARFRR